MEIVFWLKENQITNLIKNNIKIKIKKVAIKKEKNDKLQELG